MSDEHQRQQLAISDFTRTEKDEYASSGISLCLYSNADMLSGNEYLEIFERLKMKKDKRFTKEGAFAGVDYRINYYPDDEIQEKSLFIGMRDYGKKFVIDVFQSDVKRANKFIKALKKGLRRLER